MELLLIAFGAALFSYAFWPDQLHALARGRKPQKRELLESTYVGGDYRLRIRWEDGREVMVRGSCTVFHYEPSGNRCDSSVERWCSARVTALEWARKDKLRESPR
jgi:hypothetical protein